jgi:hypothetical protein
MSMLQRLFAKTQRRATRTPFARSAFQPTIEDLEDRTLLSTGMGSIAVNFNHTAIPAGDTLWFSSVFKASGVGAAGATFDFTNSTISYTAKGTNYTINAPNADVTLSPTAKQATTAYDAASNTWDTVLPLNYQGKGFLDGVAVPLPQGLPGGIKNVTWQGQFNSNTPGLTVDWQWSAAAYKKFSSDYNALDVLATPEAHARGRDRLEHAGTPEAFDRYVRSGGTGHGGRNFTGSLSPVQAVTPAPVQAAPAMLSGSVVGLNPGDVATLTLTGQGVTLTTTTDANGNFQFTGLAAGTYSLSITPPATSTVTSEMVGSVNGMLDGMSTGPTSIGSINLAAGNAGIGYGFGLSSNGGGSSSLAGG